MKKLILLLAIIALTGCMPKRETYVIMPNPYPSATPNQEYQSNQTFPVGYQAGYKEGYQDGYNDAERNRK